MTNEQFDALVRLMRQIANRYAGVAIHQPRAGHIEDDIEAARAILVAAEIDDGLDDEYAKACLGDRANT